MKKLVIACIAIAVVTGGYFLIRGKNGSRPERPDLETARVVRGDLKVSVLSTGTIQPYTRVEVSSSVSGRIDRVVVDEGDRVKEGDILAWVSSEERIALVEAARSALESARLKNDTQAEQEADRAYKVADRAYKPVPITSSIAGEVINRSCEPGQNVAFTDVLFVISDRLVASVEVDEADIGRITTGQRALIWLDAFPDERVEGRVVKISREGRIENDVVIYDVMVEVPRVPPYWSSGMTANVEFTIAEKTGVLLIPRSALSGSPGKQHVFVLEKEGVSRPVQTGISNGRMIEVTGGLGEGETVILGQGGNRFPPGGNIQRSIRMMRRMNR